MSSLFLNMSVTAGQRAAQRNLVPGKRLTHTPKSTKCESQDHLLLTEQSHKLTGGAAAAVQQEKPSAQSRIKA